MKGSSAGSQQEGSQGTEEGKKGPWGSPEQDAGTREVWSAQCPPPSVGRGAVHAAILALLCK